jgi:preprotein translocase subunit SecY
MLAAATVHAAAHQLPGDDHLRQAILSFRQILQMSQAPMLQRGGVFQSARRHLVLYGLMIPFFVFLRAIQFNPLEIADNPKKYGGYVPDYPNRPPST